VHDLTVPNERFRLNRHTPLLERDPVLLWKALSLLLALVIVVLLVLLRS
jgi:hypothetical protein